MIECIPNFSEGRRPEVIAAILAAIGERATVLDHHTDADHNRTVVSMVGDAEQVAAAAVAGIEVAAHLIDLRYHEGQHPRIGAADVVPFVPLEGATMDQCVEVARRLGQRVGDDLGLPVYLYEHASTTQRPLPEIRRGGYERLREAMPTPDYGPHEVGPAGAVVIGARQALIAFNVYLETDDTAVARHIARQIRTSSGGLPAVRALGLQVASRAQVSMNLLDYRTTPVAQVVDAIRRLAAEAGTGIHHSELVGLIPEAALVDVERWQLAPLLHDAQVLERRIAALVE